MQTRLTQMFGIEHHRIVREAEDLLGRPANAPNSLPD